MPVSGLPAVRSVTAGVGHGVAVATEGSVWTWGLNNFGQLARAAPVASAAPAKVPGMTGILGTAAGGHHTLALRPDGTGTAWGWNDSGQLGGAIPPGTGAMAAGYAHTWAGAPRYSWEEYPEPRSDLCEMSDPRSRGGSTRSTGSSSASSRHFPHDTVDELMEITCLILEEQQYSFSEEAETAFREHSSAG